MGTAPQRERSDTPDPRRGFAGERSDTPDPCRAFIGHGKDAHGTTARALRHARSTARMRTAPHRSPQKVRRRAIRHARSLRQGCARHHSESAPTRPIPVEGSSATARMRTAPHRSPQRVRRRAIRHARSPQRVRRRAQGFARHHSESAPTRPIPVEGSSASSRIRTAPQRERSDTPDPCRGFIGVEGSSASSRIRTAPQRERSDTPDPCRGFIGHGKDAHGTTARVRRHARSL